MTRFKNHWPRSGRAYVEFRFENVGDGIPAHRHDEPAQEHDALCVKGRVALIHLTGAVILKKGECAKFDSARWHTIVALEPSSVIRNRFLSDPPVDFKYYDEGGYDMYTL